MILFRYAIRALLVLLALILMIIGILSVTRATHVSTVIAAGAGNEPPAVGDSLFALEMELYTGVRLMRGNKVELLYNGEGTYAKLWADIRAAKRSIAVQMYYAEPGVVADSMRDALIERARAGVRVLVMLDAFGAADIRKSDFVPSLRDAGATVVWFRPIRWYSLNRATTRSHARIVIIDGHIGYTGGFGLADYWLGDGIAKDKWRESNVRFEGPAVAGLLAAFAASWVEATGVLLSGSEFLLHEAFDSVGPVVAGLMHTVPSVGSTSAERYLALSIAGAQRTLYITNSYFVPDQDFRNMLIEAVKRGVDVRILTVGSRTDVKTTWWAGRAYYEELLKGGLRIYEYQPTMMHAKSLVADGVWVSVGSMNFDNRSLAFNNETTLVAIDSTIGRSMNEQFMRDVNYSTEIKLETFEKRAWYKRVVEWGAEKFWRLL